MAALFRRRGSISVPAGAPTPRASRSSTPARPPGPPPHLGGRSNGTGPGHGRRGPRHVHHYAGSSSRAPRKTEEIVWMSERTAGTTSSFDARTGRRAAQITKGEWVCAAQHLDPDKRRSGSGRRIRPGRTSTTSTTPVRGLTARARPPDRGGRHHSVAALSRSPTWSTPVSVDLPPD